ncbi:hypothetical protein PIB30_095376, partial [Stylosanthes scabra]|nr:hypothetical protein [Stylosanthes scabra]
IAWSFNPRGIDTPLHCGILLDTIRYTCRDLGFANPTITDPKSKTTHLQSASKSTKSKISTPHLRPNPPMNPQPSSYDETLRTYQQESREMREAHKRTEAHLNDLAELLHKFTCQMTVNNQPPPLAGEDSDSEDEYEEVEEGEMTEIAEEATEGEVSILDKEEEFFITTIYGGNEEKPEDLPEKCADPGPYFMTCKIGKVYVPDCLCDPGGCASDSCPSLLFRTPKNNNGSNPQVLLGRPFRKTAGFKLNFYDETFSLEVGNVIEIFQPTRPPISQEESVHQARKEELVKKIEHTANRAAIPKQKKDQKTPTPTRRSMQKKVDTKTVKKKPERGKEERKTELNCTNFKDLIGKLKRINSPIVKDGSIGVHLVEDNSKWK